MVMRFTTGSVATGNLTVEHIETSWHRLGPAEFSAWPGEPSPTYSVALRERMVSPFKFTVGLANDGLGYILSPEELQNDTSGQLSGYELLMGLGNKIAPKTWAANETLGWFDGGWQ